MYISRLHAWELAVSNLQALKQHPNDCLKICPGQQIAFCPGHIAGEKGKVACPERALTFFEHELFQKLQMKKEDVLIHDSQQG